MIAVPVPPPPPSPSDLPAGTTLVAGLGVATVLADMDFETYSEAGYVWAPEEGKWRGPAGAPKGKKGLGVVGMARYAEHPTTEVLVLAYNLKDGRGPRRWVPGMPPPSDLFDHIARGGLIEAWNCGFEAWIWEKVCVARMGWPPLPRQQLRDAMAKSRAHALPGALLEAGNVFSTGARKDTDGKRLLAKFSVPRNPTKKDARLRLDPATDAEDGPRLYDYCAQDIRAEGDLSAAIPDLSPDELAVWQADQEINRRGVAVDTELLHPAIAVLEQALETYNAELTHVTGGTVASASEIQKLLGWLGGLGVHLPSLDEDGVAGALSRGDLPPAARRALEIRQSIGSASVKKLFALRNHLCDDGRLHDLFSYHGARTGRTTGNGPQATNLPSGGPDVIQCGTCGRHFGKSKPSCPWCGADAGRGAVTEWNAKATADARETLRTGSLECVEYHWDAALPVLAGCVRSFFCAGPGHDLICSDYSAIEAVVLAELAGEEWRQEVFRTHGKIYEMSASKISGVPFEEFLRHKEETGAHHPLRKKLGKVAELASGYRGWIGAWKNFGADQFMTEEEMKASILAWRDASPRIVEFWGGQHRRGRGRWVPEMYGLEGCAIAAVIEPGREFSHRGITYLMRGDALYCILPSGRPLTYHRPRLTPSTRARDEWSLSYEGWNTNPLSDPMGWVRMETHGGKLTENVVQAVARDIQWFAIRRQMKAGYHIVLHVYDENAAEVPEGWGSVEEFEALMSEMPPFAAGWPVKARGGWRGKHYRKE